MRPNVLLFGLMALSALSASLSTHAQSPSFDVVSVKPTPPDTPGGGRQFSAGRVTWRNVTLKAMVAAAYQRFNWDAREINRSKRRIVVGLIEPGGRRLVTEGDLAKGDPRADDGDTIVEIGSSTDVLVI